MNVILVHVPILVPTQTSKGVCAPLNLGVVCGRQGFELANVVIRFPSKDIYRLFHEKTFNKAGTAVFLNCRAVLLLLGKVEFFYVRKTKIFCAFEYAYFRLTSALSPNNILCFNVCHLYKQHRTSNKVRENSVQKAGYF